MLIIVSTRWRSITRSCHGIRSSTVYIPPRGRCRLHDATDCPTAQVQLTLFDENLKSSQAQVPGRGLGRGLGRTGLSR